MWLSSSGSLNYSTFIQNFETVFDHPEEGMCGPAAAEDGSSAEYAIRFHILEESGWNEYALIIMFHNGLFLDLQMDLACHSAVLSLDALITLSIKLDQYLHSLPAQPPSYSELLAAGAKPIPGRLNEDSTLEPNSFSSCPLSKFLSQALKKRYFLHLILIISFVLMPRFVCFFCFQFSRFKFL